MLFTHDTVQALTLAGALVNSDDPDGERLPDPAALDAFLDDHFITGERAGTAAELRAVHRLRARLRAVWDVADDPGAVAALLNDLFHDASAEPWLIDHDGWGWHLHLTTPDAPLAHRLAAEAAMGIADLVRTGELSRLRFCDAGDCNSVIVDLSRNRSKRYCDTGNCGNRAHVAAYRARKKETA